MGKLDMNLLWIVPRNPWPPRCGASHANTELIQGMRGLGYKIHLICFCESIDKSEQKRLSDALGVESVSVFHWRSVFTHKFIRLFFAMIWQLIRPQFPLTVLPFTSGRVVRFLEKHLNANKETTVIWDGLHPMASLFRRSVVRLGKEIHIYRAHNIESMIWKSYTTFLPRLMSWTFDRHVHKMINFENQCLKLSDAVAFVQDEDECWFHGLNGKRGRSGVVPISVPLVDDLSVRAMQRWRRVQQSSTHPQALELLWVGGLDWWPNRQALEWFAATVWRPLQQIRSGVTLTLIGRGTEHLKIFSNGSVNARGFVDNLNDAYAAADALIVPILSGSGIRVKALEALSHAVACVGTRLGLRGIPQSGTFVCESPDDWLKALLCLTPQECFMRGVLGYRAVENDLSRQRSAEAFARLLQQVQRDREEFPL